MASTIMMKMIHTRKANIRAQKAEDEVWIIQYRLFVMLTIWGVQT